MRRRLFVLLVAIATSGTNCALGADQAGPGDYIAILPSHVFPEKSLGTDGHGFGLGVLYGRVLTNRWGMEAQLGGAVLETGTEGETDFYQQALSVDAVFNFREPRGDRWTPFVLLGAGIAYDDRFPDSRDGTALLLEAGAGVVSKRVFGERPRRDTYMTAGRVAAESPEFRWG
jgi:OmpA-OmpF porin, OOP family